MISSKIIVALIGMQQINLVVVSILPSKIIIAFIGPAWPSWAKLGQTADRNSLISIQDFVVKNCLNLFDKIAWIENPVMYYGLKRRTMF